MTTAQLDQPYSAAASEAPAPPTIRIRPPKPWQPIDFVGIWQARELLGLFIMRDLKTRYKQTLLGPLWIIIMPLLSSGLFSLVFGILAGMSSGDVPLPIYIYTGMLTWNLFSRSMSMAAGSLHANQALITKVYFPRMIVPMAAGAANLIDFALGCGVLAVLMIASGIVPGVEILLAPLVIAYALVCGITLGLWLSALSVRFRDVRYAAGFLTQILMWAAPVAYVAAPVFDNDAIPQAIRPGFEFLYQMNPIYLMVEGTRFTVLGYDDARIDPLPALAGAGVMAVLLLGALLVFRKAEDTVADVV